jgi:hypothetical protein
MTAFERGIELSARAIREYAERVPPDISAKTALLRMAALLDGEGIGGALLTDAERVGSVVAPEVGRI